MMKLAVLVRDNDPFSLAVYRDQIVQGLSRLGVELSSFDEKGAIPERADIVWEPGLAGIRRPPAILRNSRKPVVVTVHGAAPFSMRWREVYPSLRQAVDDKIRQIATRIDWRWLRKKASAFIAVSQFGSQEVARIFNLRREMIYSIYHGIDHEIFNPGGDKYVSEKPYFLQVAQYAHRYSSIKNVSRILAAYEHLPDAGRPDLFMVLPGFKSSFQAKGVRLIDKPLGASDLARLYRGSLGFIFPSLRESFGLPILEAMACGCPVLTSHDTACAEVAGGAALLVDPRSVTSITEGMRRLAENQSLRNELSSQGLLRAGQFSWRKSTEEHLKVFKKVLGTIDEA